MKKLKLATIFSGIGAIEQSLKKLKIPYEIIFACDNDKFVKESYYANYKFKFWYDDVFELNKKETKKFKNKIDLLVGGSPCQSFSMLGNRKGIEDDRGNLVFKFIETINFIKPKMFIFENVKGLLTHNKGETWKIIFNKFKTLNYKLNYKLLNAKDFGIPQSRPRLYLIGYKDKRFSIKFPNKEKLKKTMFDFLEHSVNQKYYISDKGKKFVLNPMRLKKKYTQINEPVCITQTKCQQYNLNGSFVSDEYLEKYILFPKTKKFVLSKGTKNFIVKPTLNREVAHTLTATMHKMHRASFDNYIDLDNDKQRVRKLTPRECLRLMGFPDSFKIVCSDTQTYRQSGNSIVVDVLNKILLKSSFIKKFLK